MIHVDGGANSHIFRDKRHFWYYKAIQSNVTQVSGTTTTCDGMGIVLVTFPPTKIPYVLYPCYHMPNNPQNTLGLTPIKYYNCARVARVEALDWMHLVNKEGKSIKV